MKWDVRGNDGSGKLRVLLLEARDEVEAFEAGKAAGLAVVSVDPDRGQLKSAQRASEAIKTAERNAVAWGGVMVTTTFTIEGHRITHYRGLVQGLVVRSPTIGQSITGGLKSIVGGQIGGYTTMCLQARQSAHKEMINHALSLGANAIVGVQFGAAEVVSRDSATEIICYGTAVTVVPISAG